MMTPRTSALVQMHGATLLFGMSALFGKLATCSSAALVCGRALFAVAALGLLCLLRGYVPWRGIGRRDALGLSLTGVVLAGHFVTFFMGIKLAGVAIGTLGFACFPAFVTLFEALAFRERPSSREYTQIGLVTCGLLLITPAFSLADEATVGLLWGVVSGALCAVVAVANRFSARTVTGIQAAWWQNMVILTCLFPLTATELVHISATDWFWIACLGLLCTCLAYTFYINSLRIIPARLAATIITLEPVYSIIMAWALFGDPPGPRMIAGGALIILTVMASGRRT